MSETDYMRKAVEQLAIEDAAAHDARIQKRANALREADERAQRHRDLCAEYDLPETSTPRQISDAMAKRRDDVLSGVVAGGKDKFPALCRQLGLDPENLPDPWHPYECVWQTMRQQNHPLLKARRDPHTGILVSPPEPVDPRLDKIQALADRPGTAGEGAAAQAALDRIQAREATHG